MSSRVSSMLVIRPPMTAIASGCCICAPGPNAHGQRHQAQDRAEARHQDRPEPRPPGLEQGLVERHSLVAQLADVLDQDDPVLHVQADQQDGPHERRDVQRRARDPEGEQGAGQRDRLGQKDQDRQRSSCGTGIPAGGRRAPPRRSGPSAGLQTTPAAPGSSPPAPSGSPAGTSSAESFATGARG